MTGRRKRFIVVMGVLSAVAAICVYLNSARERPQTTVVVQPGKAGSLVAVLSVTNDTERDFTVFTMLQTQVGSIWCEADEQPQKVGAHLILGKGKTLQFDVELPPVRRTYRFRCGYKPYHPPAISERILQKLQTLRLPGALGESYRKAIARLWPLPRLFVTEPFQTWNVPHATPPANDPQGFSSEPRTVISYSDEYREYYPTRGRRFELDGFELEAPAVVWAGVAQRKITIVRTFGGKYGYDQQRCIMTISGEGLDQPRFLSLRGFRHIRVSWINEKLVLINVDIAHMAGVEAIYDVEEDRFVYRQSVSYGWLDAPTNLVTASQPSPAPESVPPEPAPLVPEGASPPLFLTKEVQDGMTYEIGVYVVKSGDNLTAIAHRLHLTVKELKELNPELANDSIQVGQQLRVYERPSR